MSILKTIDSNFEPVSEQYFIDNKYMFLHYNDAGHMSKYGVWFNNYYLALGFLKHDAKHFPKHQSICLRFSYSTDAKRFIVEPIFNSEEFLHTHNITFENIHIDNPSVADIETAISEINLQTRFYKLSDPVEVFLF